MARGRLSEVRQKFPEKNFLTLSSILKSVANPAGKMLFLFVEGRAAAIAIRAKKPVPKSAESARGFGEVNNLPVVQFALIVGLLL